MYDNIDNLNNDSKIDAVSMAVTYSLTQARLTSGAVLGVDKRFVLYIGGPTKGVATITITVNESGEYDMKIKYMHNGIFRLDVNGNNMGGDKSVSSQVETTLIFKINLVRGNNTLKFYGVSYQYAPYLGDFTLEKASSAITPVNPTLNYSVTQAILSSGAVLDYYRRFVLYIGGRSKGTATMSVNVVDDGQYVMELQYNRIGSFKLDVNNVDTGTTYKTTSTGVGMIPLGVNLNSGANTLRFYGITSEYAPSLGAFTLKNNYSPTNTSTLLRHNVTEGILASGAVIYYIINMVLYIGGYNNGSSTVTVNAPEAGPYEMALKYTNANANFNIDVNRVSTGMIYTSPAQSSGEMKIKLNLRKGNNEIKFYGETRMHAPFLGEFTLARDGSTIVPNPAPVPSLDYNLKDGLLENGAVESMDMVTKLGGVNRGQATIQINVSEAGKYNIEIEFINGSRAINLDANGVSTGAPIIFPAQVCGKHTIKNISLNAGQNTLKFYGDRNRFAPSLGNFNLIIDKTPTPAVVTTPSNYSVTSGSLSGGATLDSARGLVVSLGGTRNGASTVTVNVRDEGDYNISLDFQSGGRPLRINVNGRSTGRDYLTPVGRIGTFNTIITLRRGRNTIKFYGNGRDNASDLGAFTLTKIQALVVLPPGTYDTINGIFENNVTVDRVTNFTNNIGGPQNGSITMTVNVGRTGRHRIEVDYLSPNNDLNLNIDVNGGNIGLYNFPRTIGNNLSDVLTYTFQIYLNSGDNIIRFYGDGINYAPMLGKFKLSFVAPPSPLRPTPTPPPTLPSYNFRDLNSLNYRDLVSVLKTIAWNEIPGLFTFSSESYVFFSDMNRFQAIIDGLRESGRNFTDSSEEGIDTLIEVLRAGYYLGYYNSQLSQLNTSAAKDRCLPAIKEVTRNRHFRFGTQSQDKVIFAIGKLVGNASLDNEILNAFVILINDFNRNMASYSSEYYKSMGIFKIMRESDYFLNSLVHRNNNDVTSTPYYNRIDNFIGALENLARAAVNSTDSSIPANCIYVLGRLAQFKSNKTSIHRALTDCTNIYPRLSLQYFEILYSLRNSFNDTFADGSPINYDDRINEGKNRYLPNIYRFDNGNFIIRTGRNVTQEKVKRLYWAAKEVRAQFIRMVGSDRPLSQGNPDDTLTTVVYNSPDEYKLNLRLYGHPTNNGGMYIETEGNFYTYERTTQQSRFSLEELFRHEYTHYLQGRYLVPGMWGRGNFYVNNVEKLTWYDEGNAEFFAGSTRTEGVKPRSSIIEYLTNRSLPHIGTVLRSKYSSSNFYNTSCAIFLYMYNNNLGMFRTINSYIRADDVNAYDNYINVLANDNNLNALYRQSTNDLIQNIATLTVPMVSDDYILRHQRTSQQQIQRDIESVISLGSVRVTTANSQFFTTIVVKGTYNAGRAYGEITDWQTMNRTVDRALEDLSRRPWTGYKTFTAYFTEYKADSGYAIFMVTFHGVLNII